MAESCQEGTLAGGRLLAAKPCLRGFPLEEDFDLEVHVLHFRNSVKQIR